MILNMYDVRRVEALRAQIVEEKRHAVELSHWYKHQQAIDRAERLANDIEEFASRFLGPNLDVCEPESEETRTLDNVERAIPLFAKQLEHLQWALNNPQKY